MRGLRSAVQLLTVIPVRAGAPPGSAAAWLPAVGALIGVAGGLVYLAAAALAPPPVASALALVCWALLTGALHEDALADVADAFRAGREPERILEIMKDSRIGVFGAVALLLAMLLRWSSLPAIGGEPGRFLLALAAAHGAGRGAMVMLAWIAPPAGQGLGAAFQASLSWRGALAAAAQTVALALACGWRPALVMLSAAALITLAARGYFMRRIRGVTGDCLGATGYAVEIFILGMFTCRNCTW
ncbi:MAG: adenosylcobinamide-GDP ribazoletransferase [Bryobacteraceae bacterium]|nr:adenosylcobinamide-GDP ribazoletransferase [Bryobacteraceae bacterium]